MLQGRSSISANLELSIRDTLALAPNFNSCNFNLIPLSCNRAAHLVAKYVPSLDSPLTWDGDFPISAQLEASLDLLSN